MTSSSTPVTVATCGAFQLSGVNVTLFGETVPSPSSLLVNENVTLAIGAAFSETLKVASLPSSLVSSPAPKSSVTPAVSSSVLVTGTSSAFKPSYSSSLLSAAASTIE